MFVRTLLVALLLAFAAASQIALAEELGPEMVVDGGFSEGGTYWTLGYSWQTIPGYAFHNEGYTAPIEQATAALTGGTTYLVSYAITGSSASTHPYHRFWMRGAIGNAGCPPQVGDGIFTCYVVAPERVSSIQIRPGSGLGAVLDDVSIREVLP